jgi:hypothetical protein
VYGQLRRRSDGHRLKGLGVRIAYWLIYRLSEIRIPPNATDFRLLARPVIDAVNACQEQNRYLRGLVHWVGFRQTGFPYDRAERKAGKSTAGLLFCIQYALNAVLAFSSQPLRLASYAGLIIMSLSILGAAVYTALFVLASMGKLASAPPPGLTTILIVIFFMMGMQSLFLGLAGEYLANVYREAKGRPLWIVETAQGFETQSGLQNLAAAMDHTRLVTEAPDQVAAGNRGRP